MFHVHLFIHLLNGAQDALMAYDEGLAGVVLSNHGGRQLDFARSGIEVLVEVVQKLFDAVARGDIEGALGYVRPDGELVNPDNAMELGTRRGLTGVRIALRALRDSFAELRFDISEMVDGDDRVLVTGTFYGVGRTSEAAFGPQAFGSVVTLAGNQIQRYQWYLDADEAREAAGLPEPQS